MFFYLHSDWQQFRDEQIFLLNWLAQKEKLLRDMEDTDITDEKQVDAHLDTLRVRLSQRVPRMAAMSFVFLLSKYLQLLVRNQHTTGNNTCYLLVSLALNIYSPP